ncbi:MAG TPA: AraC family transcriptional regulator [Polyangiales bacterium]|nr:AraC family transcriptional regulator [Polyangiales bacterium]
MSECVAEVPNDHLTIPDSAAMGIEKYDCRLRSWHGCTWRNIHLLGKRGMNLQSPNKTQTRVAFLLDNGNACAQFRSAPSTPARQHDVLHSLCLVPAGATVWAHSDRGGPLELSSIAFDVQESSALLGENVSHDTLSTPQLNFTNERLWQFASQLSHESRAPGEFSTLYCESLLLLVLIEVLRLDPAFRSPATRGGLSQRQLKLATEFIEDNLSSHISLRDLAELTGLSSSHFSHAFKQSTGMPPHRWQLRSRIRRAQELLASTPLPLSHVALATGFADQSHFTRVFRRFSGVTPHAWRVERK